MENIDEKIQIRKTFSIDAALSLSIEDVKKMSKEDQDEYIDIMMNHISEHDIDDITPIEVVDDKIIYPSSEDWS